MALAVALIAPAGGTAAQERPPRLRELDSGTAALLQAVSAVDARVVWVTGHQGVVLRSRDGGETWERLPGPAGDSLEFRDVHAFDAERAVILSAGEGARSRIYRTGDGGRRWTLAWLNDEPAGFYDCLDFWDTRRGVAYGDAVGGELRILLTEDGGRSWRRVAPPGLPAALDGEGGFAASGTCVRTGAGGVAWIGTGAGPTARVLRTRDYGRTWSAADVPLVAGPAAGAFTLAFSGPTAGVVLGGDLEAPEGSAGRAAATDDGGATWREVEAPPFPGAVYGAAATAAGALVTVGPGGAAVRDAAGSWHPVDTRAFWAVGAAGGRAWAVGPEGRIVRLEWADPAGPRPRAATPPHEEDR